MPVINTIPQNRRDYRKVGNLDVKAGKLLVSKLSIEGDFKAFTAKDEHKATHCYLMMMDFYK